MIDINRLATTYYTIGEAAREAGPQAIVVTKVAQDVWDYLRSLATVPEESLPPGTKMWGHPLLLEENWEPGRIEVHTIRRIW